MQLIITSEFVRKDLEPKIPFLKLLLFFLESLFPFIASGINSDTTSFSTFTNSTSTSISSTSSCQFQSNSDNDLVRKRSIDSLTKNEENAYSDQKNKNHSYGDEKNVKIKNRMKKEQKIVSEFDRLRNLFPELPAVFSASVESRIRHLNKSDSWGNEKNEILNGSNTRFSTENENNKNNSQRSDNSEIYIFSDSKKGREDEKGEEGEGEINDDDEMIEMDIENDVHVEVEVEVESDCLFEVDKICFGNDDSNGINDGIKLNYNKSSEKSIRRNRSSKTNKNVDKTEKNDNGQDEHNKNDSNDNDEMNSLVIGCSDLWLVCLKCLVNLTHHCTPASDILMNRKTDGNGKMDTYVDLSMDSDQRVEKSDRVIGGEREIKKGGEREIKKAGLERAKKNCSVMDICCSALFLCLSKRYSTHALTQQVRTDTPHHERTKDVHGTYCTAAEENKDVFLSNTLSPWETAQEVSGQKYAHFLKYYIRSVCCLLFLRIISNILW